MHTYRLLLLDAVAVVEEHLSFFLTEVYTKIKSSLLDSLSRRVVITYFVEELVGSYCRFYVWTDECYTSFSKILQLSLMPSRLNGEEMLKNSFEGGGPFAFSSSIGADNI